MRGLLIFAATVVLLALALEAAVRVRSYVKYGDLRPASSYETHAVSGLMIPIPGRTTKSLAIDSRGFRSPEVEMPKPAGRVRLGFLGGSTTFCAEASSNEAAWPALVCEGLARRNPKLEFDFVNAGVAGYRLEHLSKNLTHRVEPLDPDVLIVYEATNDLTCDSRDLAIEQGIYSGHADQDDWLSDLSLAWYLLKKNVLMVVRHREGMRPQDKLEFDADRLAAPFRERMVALIRQCQAVTPAVVVATFSHRLRPDQTREQQAEASGVFFYAMPYMTIERLLASYRAYNQAVCEAARQTGSILIEGEDEIPADSIHFMDSMHFTDAGSQQMAERVLRGLDASSAFQAYLASRKP